MVVVVVVVVVVVILGWHRFDTWDTVDGWITEFSQPDASLYLRTG